MTNQIGISQSVFLGIDTSEGFFVVAVGLVFLKTLIIYLREKETVLIGEEGKQRDRIPAE